jgi:2-hydroxychromene-2-carboxylate isomerase
MRHHRRVAPEFFLGAMSPYAWFTAERIDALVPSALWRPVFLGGLFKAVGRSSWALGEARERGMEECEARARSYGLGEIRWPERWPTNDLLVARGMTFAERKGALKPFALAAMRMAFQESADLGEAAVVLEAGRRSGIDAAELDTALADAEVKDALRAATEEAHARGVFGVPTVIVGDELFWGDDELGRAAAAVTRATGAAGTGATGAAGTGATAA